MLKERQREIEEMKKIAIKNDNISDFKILYKLELQYNSAIMVHNHFLSGGTLVNVNKVEKKI